MKETTLCYIEYNNCYLMMLKGKKKNDINSGKWVGIGGHVEEGETASECIMREISEETGLSVSNLKYKGKVLFCQKDGYREMMHLFTATSETDKIKECDEGDMSWIKKECISELPIWEGDYVFLDLLCKDLPFFSLTLIYDGDKLINKELNFPQKDD